MYNPLCMHRGLKKCLSNIVQKKLAISIDVILFTLSFLSQFSTHCNYKTTDYSVVVDTLLDKGSVQLIWF